MDEQNRSNDLKRAIIKVIAFFDIFDFPLTNFEVWKYASVQCELAEVQAILLGDELNGIVDNKNGMYFLCGREEVYVTRMKRYNYANAKFKKALRITKIFGFIPWIKMIAIGNMIGANNLKQESDIDFFIVTEKKRIWLTRFLCATLAKFLRLRPKQNNYRDKICLSFFISEDALDLRPLKLQNDQYLLHWLADLTPIYDRDSTYQKFIIANQWLKEGLPNWFEIQTNNRIVKAQNNIFYHDIIGLMFGGLEGAVKKIQMRLLPRDKKEIMNTDGRVIVNDSVLKFHVNDRREEYNKIYSDKIFNLG